MKRLFYCFQLLNGHRLLRRLDQLLRRCEGGRSDVFAAQETCDLADLFLIGQRVHRSVGHDIVGVLPDAVVARAVRGNLRQVRDADDLVTARDLQQFAADDRRRDPADSAVYFIEDHRRNVIVVADYLLEGQHDAGHLAA